MSTTAAITFSPKQNTKVEVLAEALENMCLAITAQGIQRNEGKKLTPLAEKFMVQARFGIREALREFMQPALTLIEGGARQEYTEDTENQSYVEPTSRVKCGECNRHFVCSDTQCPHWHKAVRLACAPPAPEVPGDNVA